MGALEASAKAGIIESSSGRLRAAPSPFSMERRLIDFFVMNIRLISLIFGYCCRWCVRLLVRKTVHDSQNQRLNLVVGCGCLTVEVIRRRAIIRFDSAP